eukprot:4468494-Amphidinium_carterae.1
MLLMLHTCWVEADDILTGAEATDPRNDPSSIDGLDVIDPIAEARDDVFDEQTMLAVQVRPPHWQ